MKANKILVAAVLAVALAMTLVGVSVATDDTSGTAPEVAKTLSESISAFRSEAPKADQAELAAVISQSGRMNADLAAVNLGYAKSARVPGSQRKAWIAPAGEETCVFIPVEPDAYAFTCPTLEDIAEGRGVIVNDPDPGVAGDLVTVAAIVPDGTDPPQTSDVVLAVVNNIAVTRVAPAGTLTTAAGTLDLAAFAKSPDKARPVK